jgi:hypothetical protein
MEAVHKEFITHRLKSGKLIIAPHGLSIPFVFGLVFDIKGRIQIEIHFTEDSDIQDFYHANKKEFQENVFRIECTTEDGYVFKAFKIDYISIPFNLNKAILDCYGHIYIQKEKDEIPGETEPEVDYLHFIKLEGLKLKFTNHSDITSYRDHEEMKLYDLNQPIWDHSVVVMQIGFNQYKTIWRKDEFDLEGDSIIVEFKGRKSQFQSLSYEEYQKIKLDFLSLLSFANGANVNIRAEYYGQYYSAPKLDAQKKTIYSFTKVENQRHNKYVPINLSEARNDRIIDKMFQIHFNLYREWNEKLDLNGIIFYLCNSEQTISIDERVFIQTIILEKLSDSYAKTLEGTTQTFLPENINEQLKTELTEVLKKYETHLKENFNTVKGKILNFNQVKRNKTDVKMRKLIQDVGLEMNPIREELISVIRHSTIHSGDIGKERYRNYFELDILIRNIILRLIKYEGPVFNPDKNS